MKITQLLKKDNISLSATPQVKEEAIDILIDLMYKHENITNEQAFKRAILKRESEGSTGIGGYIAIPHGKSSSVTKVGLSAMVVKDGVDFQSLDSDVAKLFFMIAVPEYASNKHLEVLAKLSSMLMDEDFKNALISAKSTEEFLSIIDKKEEELSQKDIKLSQEDSKSPQKENKNQAVKSDNPIYKILGVTACPTGIAHTYMAAESLENNAKNKNISIKVETNGSGGAKNILTKEEIKNADTIIVAADIDVNMKRFDGKRVIKVKVSDGIHKASELIDKAISGNVPVYKHLEEDGNTTFEDTNNESFARQAYKHLMSGVSNMLPFVIGGGILIAIAFLLDDYSIDPSKFGSNTPLAAMFMNIGGTSFGFMLPVLAGYIAYSIADRPGLAVGFVGGALANSGGSGFLGALVAGFAAGYLMNLLKKATSSLPKSLEGTKPVLIFPLVGILAIGLVMLYIINPVVGGINTAMTNGLNSMSGSSKIILGLLLGAMMAVDMGGPVNKAAYVFGTASLANGSSDIMAAVMAGGMVPPLAIAFATMIFKNKFTEKERQSGPTNLIMGFSFITEGAIPFAAADPTRVLPSCIIGSGIAGAMSMALGCSLRAPHGGIWVIGVIQNPIGYIVALLAGSIVGMMLLGVLKKPVVE